MPQFPLIRDAVKAHSGGLNRLNVYPVPDGDTGTNMALTMQSVTAEVDGGLRLEAPDPGTVKGPLRRPGEEEVAGWRGSRSGRWPHAPG